MIFVSLICIMIYYPDHETSPTSEIIFLSIQTTPINETISSLDSKYIDTCLRQLKRSFHLDTNKKIDETAHGNKRMSSIYSNYVKIYSCSSVSEKLETYTAGNFF